MMGSIRLQMYINDVSKWSSMVNDAIISVERILIECKTPVISGEPWQRPSERVNLHSLCQNSNTCFHYKVKENNSYFLVTPEEVPGCNVCI
jgi:hypothetical protein